MNRRPLIKDTKNIASKVAALYEARKNFYDIVSHLTFDTSGMRPNQVVDDVIRQLKNINNAKKF